MDYKLNEEENFIEKERKKTCAFDIYLLEVYLNLADGIIEDDFDLVRGETTLACCAVVRGDLVMILIILGVR